MPFVLPPHPVGPHIEPRNDRLKSVCSNIGWLVHQRGENPADDERRRIGGQGKRHSGHRSSRGSDTCPASTHGCQLPRSGGGWGTPPRSGVQSGVAGAGGWAVVPRSRLPCSRGGLERTYRCCPAVVLR